MPIMYNGDEIGKIILNGVEHELWYNGEKFFPEEKSPFPTVTIGTQTWMSKNLAIDDGQGGIYTQTVNYGQGNVVEYYYNWNAAVRVAAAVAGWHLPSKSEWDQLANAIGGSSTAGTKLKSTYGWDYSGNGTDDYSFSSLPAGQWYVDSGKFTSKGSRAVFWTADQYSSKNGVYCMLEYKYANLGSYNYNKGSGYSVRLVKDA